ncbi:MAG TPA: hypothetical protein DDY91_16190, partial [Planctomycetaceae bacterium]|nr:hypothetical protein [Planctomycetaceae bacterium]
MQPREAALSSAEEGVVIRRTLAATRPDAFLPDLAMSLNNPGNRQSVLGQREAALLSSREAVRLYLGFSRAFPERFLQSLLTATRGLHSLRKI